MRKTKMFFVLLPIFLLLSSCTSPTPKIFSTTRANATEPIATRTPTEIQPTLQILTETPQSSFPLSQFLLEQYNPTRVVLLSSDGKEQRQVLNFAPAKVAMSPDGKKLAYLSNGVVTILDMVTQKATPFNYETSGNLPFDNISWSPDGTQIGFGCLSKITQYLELCLLNMTNGTREEATNYLKLGIKSSPSLDGVQIGNWSADGSQIVFVTRSTPEKGNAWGIIQIYRPQEKIIQTVLDERKVSGMKNVTSPTISPDGKTILFQAKPGDHTAIYRIWSDGTHLERLTPENYSFNISNPMWDSTGRYFVTQAQDQSVQKVKSVPTIFSSKGVLLYQFDLEGSVKSWIGVAQ